MFAARRRTVILGALALPFGIAQCGAEREAPAEMVFPLGQSAGLSDEYRAFLQTVEGAPSFGYDEWLNDHFDFMRFNAAALVRSASCVEFDQYLKHQSPNKRLVERKIALRTQDGQQKILVNGYMNTEKRESSGVRVGYTDGWSGVEIVLNPLLKSAIQTRNVVVNSGGSFAWTSYAESGVARNLETDVSPSPEMMLRISRLLGASLLQHTLGLDQELMSSLKRLEQQQHNSRQY